MKNILKMLLAGSLLLGSAAIGLTGCDSIKPARQIDNLIFRFDVSDLPLSDAFLALIADKDKRVQRSDSRNDVTPEERVVYLTFDDGPSNNTQEILDILDRYDVKATWFVLGDSDNFDKITDIWNAGHQVAVHSTTHVYNQIYASPEAFWEDFDATAKKIKETLKLRHEPTLFRFPGGSNTDYNKSIREDLFEQAAEKQLHFFDWNADSTDASGNNVPAETLVSRTISSSAGSNSCCLLMHDTDAKGTTVEALPQIIEYYISEGYSFQVLTADSYGYRL